MFGPLQGRPAFGVAMANSTGLNIAAQVKAPTVAMRTYRNSNDARHENLGRATSQARRASSTVNSSTGV